MSGYPKPARKSEAARGGSTAVVWLKPGGPDSNPAPATIKMPDPSKDPAYCFVIGKRADSVHVPPAWLGLSTLVPPFAMIRPPVQGRGITSERTPASWLNSALASVVIKMRLVAAAVAAII